MPRIDPERLLKCLQPLLEPASGAIKSNDEVDKILGLMSKFSKKLVSKCIYVNILKATSPSVVDLFMQRGGWNLVFTWTNEAIASKNHALLSEILQLLLVCPISVERLKENKFPMLLKTYIKDSGDLDTNTRDLSRQVIARWLQVAKVEEENLQLQSLGYPQQIANQGLHMDHGINHSTVPQDLGSVTADSLLNIEPSLIPGAELDLDISNTDLSTIDFNLDILSKVVDTNQQQPPPQMEVALPEMIPTPNNVLAPVGVQIPLRPELQHTNNIIYANSVNPSNFPMHAVEIQQQPPQPVKQNVIEMIQVQPAPKIYIKTIEGQRTVVQSLGSEAGQYCLLIKGDKNYVVKVKDPAAPNMAVPVLATNPNAEPLQVQIATSSGIKTENSLENIKHKKDKSSKAHKKELKAVTTNKVPTSGNSSGIKTYGSPKSKTATGVKESTPPLSNKKPLDQLIKSADKPEKDKKPLKEKASSNESHKKSKSSSSRSKAEAAAAAAKQQAEEEKLRDEIRKQKALMRKRAKEQEKQKQKDEETLKKLNLVPLSSTSSSSLKIPKIPKKNSSFIDAIGIPGADDINSIEKIKKVSPDKEKSSKLTEETSVSSPTKKSAVKKEEDDEPEKPKERRHKMKVFVSSRNRSDDLIDEMMTSGKSKLSKEKEKEKEKEEVKPTINFGNSIPAVPPKAMKRLSTEAMEKPGDSKKAKLGDGNGKAEKSKESPTKEKEKKKSTPTISLKESSLFMEAINASSENTKPSKRKRRPSTGSEKEKSGSTSPVEKSPKLPNEDLATLEEEVVTLEESVKKPVFNFYRDTLNDSADEDISEERSERPSESTSQDAQPNVEPMDEGGDNDSGSFTPQEKDGILKSALCLHRPKNRPRKAVRWREDEDLREFHYFEMDETERVNVTKHKDFCQMSQQEKAIERSYLGNRHKVDEEEIPQNTWRMVKLEFEKSVVEASVTSTERGAQEERESRVLGLFLPPGADLPPTPIEPDISSPVDRIEARMIPVEDVNSITKVCDYRTHSWPAPKPLLTGNPVGYHVVPQQMDEFAQNPPINPFPPSMMDFGNPWSNAGTGLGFGVPPPIPNIADMSSFQHFPPPTGVNIGMNFLGAAPPNAFQGTNPFTFPPSMVPQVNGPTVPGQMDPFAGNNREGRNHQNRGGRFNNDTDHRRNFQGGRDGGRDRGGNRDRDYRDDRGGRDRDFRRRDRDNRDNNDRDYRHDRERNNRDHRSGSSGRNTRKEIPCRYFKKGFCTNGSRCEFLHDSSNSNEKSHDSGRSRRSPEPSKKDIDLKQSLGADDWEDESSSGKQNVANESDATRFALPPSSPTEPEMPSFASNTESTKVIPV